MGDGETKQKKVEAVSNRELSSLRDALSSKYGAYLRPGESLSIDAERLTKHAWATVCLESADDSERLEIECASLPEDHEGDDAWDAKAELERVLDLLDLQLDAFFAEDRMSRFHDDWRVYESLGSALRLRGSHRRPNLEALADEWLAAGGDPGNEEFD